MTKILLVEDDKSLREIYGVRLLAEGYDIVSAGDGEEALAMAIKDRPDLIVSDVMMPKISGFDMLDILRSTTETKDIKVIMMTALSSEEQRQRGVALGADRYLVKSQVGIEDVVRTVHEVLADAPVAGQAPLAPKPISTTPTPAPAPAPMTTSPSMSPAPTPASPESALPQPTAPFSTPRVGNLGDRVIQPLQSNGNSAPDFSSMIEKELSNTPAPAPQPMTPSQPVAATPTPTVSPAPAQTPAPQPVSISSPAPVAPVPVQPAPQPQQISPQPSQPAQPPIAPRPVSSGMEFEETPRQTPPTPPIPPAQPPVAGA